MGNLTPAQEPVAWGVLATAILEVAVVFAPRFGFSITTEQQTAVAALIAAVIPIVVGFFVRQNTIPAAPAPPLPATPPPPSVTP